MPKRRKRPFEPSRGGKVVGTYKQGVSLSVNHRGMVEIRAGDLQYGGKNGSHVMAPKDALTLGFQMMRAGAHAEVERRDYTYRQRLIAIRQRQRLVKEAANASAASPYAQLPT